MLKVNLNKLVQIMPYITVIKDGEEKVVKNSIERIAKMTGLSTETIYRLKVGKNVSLKNINKLCEFCDCQPCDFIEYESGNCNEENNGKKA